MVATILESGLLKKYSIAGADLSGFPWK
jgi:hypothetical protein